MCDTLIKLPRLYQHIRNCFNNCGHHQLVYYYVISVSKMISNILLHCKLLNLRVRFVNLLEILPSELVPCLSREILIIWLPWSYILLFYTVSWCSIFFFFFVFVTLVFLSYPRSFIFGNEFFWRKTLCSLLTLQKLSVLLYIWCF